jgi:hypothetical protein
VDSYPEGHILVSSGPGLGVEPDRGRVEDYAESYRREGAGFGFHGPGALTGAPALPKR